MNINKPYANILYYQKGIAFEEGLKMLKFIEYCGRISHRSEDKITDDSYKRFIQAVVIEHGDWSITEHASVSVEFLVDRGITHELVRHRLFSYTQESTRFVNYEKKMPASFIRPYEIEKDSNEDFIWQNVTDFMEKGYIALVKTGVKPQIARSILPNALASKIVMTGNLRSWRHFFIMRTTKETHPQMKEVTIPLLSEFKEFIPILYDDIQPNNRQIDNMRLPK